MKILIISKTVIDFDPRPNRQVEYFTQQIGQVDTLSVGDKYSSATKKFSLTEDRSSKLLLIWRVFLLFFRRFEYFYTSSKIGYDKNVLIDPYDVIVAHDPVTLPIAFQIRDQQSIKTKIIADLHEYFPSQRENSKLWRWFYRPYVNYLCKKYLPIVDGIVTVNDTIAEKYSDVFKIDKPEVVRNIPKEVKGILPAAVSEERIHLVHHGLALKSRGTEEMIKIMDYLDPEKYTFDLILINKPADRYFKKIKEQINQYPNIRLLEPLPFDQIIPFTNRYDIGVFLLPPLTYNYHYALPNKLFEYIQARLTVAIGPSPEMKKIVNDYKVGVISDDFTAKSFAKEISKLSKSQIEEYKNNSHIASSKLTADSEMQIYIEYVRNIANKKVNI